MNMWFYQLSHIQWPLGEYCLQVWQSEVGQWPPGRICSSERPVPGDCIVFFYAPSDCPAPGFYGWAVVTEWSDDDSVLGFRPVAPSDHLKMDPWWNDTAREIANEIRGKFKQGTLWHVPQDLAAKIGRGISSWVAGK